MPKTILPPTRPQWPQERVIELALERWYAKSKAKIMPAVFWLAMRGYYRDSMGRKGMNDLNIYDDAFFLSSPEVFASYNANADPERYGINRNIRKPYAALEPGVWLYKPGIHHPSKPSRYAAFIQAGPVTVRRRPREGDEGYVETGYFGINVHRGVRTRTSSEGCLTIWPDQWPAFKETTYAELHRNQQATIPLILVHGQG